MDRPRKRAILAIFVIHAVLLLSVEPVSAASKQILDRAAKKACLAGDPGKGVELLAELYVDTNDITYIFNQGRCFEQNRRYEDAIGRFREYLLKGESQLSPADKAVAQKHIETCESYLPKSEPPPVPGPAPVQPVVQPAPDQIPPPAIAVAQQPPRFDEKSGQGLRIAGIATGSLGVAALISGVILNLKVNSMASDLEKPDNFNRDTDSSRKTYKTLGWVSYGAGTACLVSGSLLYYLGRRSGHDSTASVAFIPGLGPGSAGAVLTGAF
jgi:hypothetical protein